MGARSGSLCRRLVRGDAVATALLVALTIHPAAADPSGERPATSDDAKAQQSDSGKNTGDQKNGAKASSSNKDAEAKPKESDDRQSGDADKAPSKPAKKPGETSSTSDDNLWTRKTLLGDIGPVRPFLAKYGATLNILETDEVLGNVSGGKSQGAIYEGLTDLSLGIDLRPTLDIRGNIYAHAYQIHGRGLTPTIGSLNEMSGIEAAATTRLAELWYEQHFDTVRIRIGQQTVTTDFLNPATSRLFVNGTFGWPTLPSLDLPSGGPGFPLGTPAVRLRVDPVEGLTLFTALFNGDPTGGGVGASQLLDASGTAFRVGDGAFVISELRYNPDSSDEKGTYRGGGWYNSERFRDLHFDTNGTSLASPLSNGQARLHDGNFSLYAVIDQPFLIDKNANTSFAAFGRAMGAPGDRNLVDLYLDAGLAYKGPFGRAGDQVGIAAAYARVGQAARDFDADVGRFNSQAYPVRSGEPLLEVTYRFQVTPWLQVQPDFQYVFNPGGGAANPNAPVRRIGDAAVFGLRVAVTL